MNRVRRLDLTIHSYAGKCLGGRFEERQEGDASTMEDSAILLGKCKITLAEGHHKDLAEAHDRSENFILSGRESAKQVLRPRSAGASTFDQIDEEIGVQKYSAHSQPSRNCRTNSSGSTFF